MATARIISRLFSLTLLALFAGSAAAGRAAASPGQDLYNDECASCHSVGSASTPSGPTLKGVVWRGVASLQDFAYSRALRSAGGSWSPDRLDVFLSNTQAFAPGTDMFFEIYDRDERRAIIDYLRTLK